MSLNSAMPIEQPQHQARQRARRDALGRSAGARSAVEPLVGLRVRRAPRAAPRAAPPPRQQAGEHLQAEALAGERADAREQARGGGRHDRDRVALAWVASG